MNRQQTQLQHGDVLLQPVARLPKDAVAVPRRSGRLILAEGEATGHHHTVTDQGAALYQIKGELYLEVTSEAVTITHEEHKPITVPAGVYKVGQVREYDYFAEMERRVVD